MTAPRVGERVDRVEIDVSLRRMIVNVGYAEGDVVAVREDGEGPRQVDVAVRLGTGDGVCADAEATLELP